MNDNEKMESGHWFVKLIESFIPDPNIDLTGDPHDMTKTASWKAFSISTIAGIPPGPFGLATILPEIMAITKLQINLIYRIAKYYNKEEKINSTLIIHVFITGFGIAMGRSLLRKVGTRFIVRALTTQAIKKVAQQIGARIGIRALQRVGGRWIPIISAPIFGAFSKSQTTKIGNAAIELFSKEIEQEKTVTCSNGHEVPGESKFCPECGEQIS